MRFLLAVTASGVLAGAVACLPERDNPFDTGPVVEIETPIGAAGRFQTVELDASAACFDPVSQVRDCTGYTFAWELHDPDLDTDVGPQEYEDYSDCELVTDSASRVACTMGAASSLETRLALTRDMLCPGAADGECIGWIARRVRARVTDPDGRIGFGSADVIQQNSVPLASLGEDLFVSERTDITEVIIDGCANGGILPDGSAVSCLSFDPDGDPLEFHDWSLVGLGAISPVGDLRRARYVPDLQLPLRPVVIEVDVFDADRWAKTRAHVRLFRAPQIWAGTGGPARTVRVFPDFRVAAGFRTAVAGTSQLFKVVTLAIDDAFDPWYGGIDRNTGAGTEGSTLIVHLTRDFDEVERWEIPTTTQFNAIAGLVPPTATLPGYAAFRSVKETIPSATAPPSGFLQLAGSGTNDVCTAPTSRPCHHWPAPAGETVQDVGRDPATGDGWLLTRKGLYRMAASNGSVTQVATLTTGADLTIEADGTVWVSERMPFAANIATQSVLHRFVNGSATLSKTLSGARITAMAPRKTGGVFAVDDGTRQLLHFDAVGNATALLSEISAGPVGFNLLASDPVDGTLWVVDNTYGRLRRFREGSGGLEEDGWVPIEEMEVGNNWNAVAPDPRTGGAYASVPTATLDLDRIARIPPHLKRTHVLSEMDGHVGKVKGDPAGGSVWVTGDPVQRRAWTGRLIGEWSNPGIYQALAVDDRGRAWAGTSTAGTAALRILDPVAGEVRRFTLAAEPKALEIEGRYGCLAIGTAGALARIDVLNESLQSLQPFTLDPLDRIDQRAAASADGTCLFRTFGNPKPYLLRYRPGATAPDMSRELVEVEGPLGIALDPRDGSAWVGEWYFPNYPDSGLYRFYGQNDTPQLYKIGAPVDVFVSISAIPFHVRVRKRCDDAGDPRCVDVWAALRAAYLRRVDADGVVRENVRLPPGQVRAFDLVR